MTIGSDIRDTHFESIYQATKDFGRVQFVEKIESLENIIDSLEEEIQDLYIERTKYDGYEQYVEDLHKDIETFMFKLKIDKCYTKELEEFIRRFGGELFNQ